MGGMFQPQQTPAQVISPIPQELGPFAQQLIQAVSQIFMNPGQGVTPLEESTIRGIFQQAEPARGLLDATLRGEYLPGADASNANPFLGALMQGIEAQGDVARRQLGSAAQRAGMLGSTDYLNQASGLESSLTQKRNEQLFNLYGQERDRQYGSIGALGSLGQMLLGTAGVPRQVATEQTRYPYELGTGLLTGNRAAVSPGTSGPSPFASLLSGIGSLSPLFVGF